MYASSFFSLLVLFLFKSSDAVRVTTTQGVVEGGVLLSRNGTEYYAFLSIPFGKPPIGDLRFEPPQPANSWKGVLNVTAPPPKCVQGNGSGDEVLGSEDCLYLSVYTPAKNVSKLPVFVGIHGGGFVAGFSGVYNPSYFMDHEIIFVSIQYRLHFLGFLSTGDDILPGNVGMKDQVMALKWVQKNIAAFGGDPSKVTIYGESAGGAIVQAHLYSPLSKGLFTAGISGSGNFFAPWAHFPRDLTRRYAQTIGTLLHCPTESSEKLAKCLKKVPAEEFPPLLHKFVVASSVYMPPVAITSEPANSKGAFLTENPWHLEVVNKVPWMVGVTSNEAAPFAFEHFMHNDTEAKILNENYKRLFPIFFYYESILDSDDRIEYVTESLKSFYFRDQKINMENVKNLANLISDAYFNYYSLAAARRYNNVVYYFVYDHRNKKRLIEFPGNYSEDLGVGHGDYLISLFQVFPEPVTEGDDFIVSQRMINYFINFASKRNPNGDEEIWTPMKSDKLEHLYIRTKYDKMETDLFKERYLLWRSFNITPKSSTNSAESKYGISVIVHLFMYFVVMYFK